MLVITYLAHFSCDVDEQVCKETCAKDCRPTSVPGVCFSMKSGLAFLSEICPLTAVSNLQPWHVNDTGFEEDTFHFFHENIEKNRRSILVLGFSQVLEDTRQISRSCNRNQIPRSIVFQPPPQNLFICSVQLGVMALVSNPSKYGRVMNSRLS